MLIKIKETFEINGVKGKKCEMTELEYSAFFTHEDGDISQTLYINNVKYNFIRELTQYEIDLIMAMVCYSKDYILLTLSTNEKGKLSAISADYIGIYTDDRKWFVIDLEKNDILTNGV